MDYDDDIVTALDTAIASLTRGTNLFRGPVRGHSGNIPHAAVFVTRSGGGTIRAIKTSSETPGVPTVSERSPVAQIRIRSDLPGAPTAFSDGQTLADAVYTALHHQPPTGYCDWYCVAGGPLYLGPDESKRHEWSVNLTVQFDT